MSNTTTIPARSEFHAALLEQDAADDAWQDYLRRHQPIEYARPGEATAINQRCHDARAALLALIERLPA